MGAQLTTNYSNIKETFRYDFWNIHSATHKNTNEAVSLWIIDSDRFSKRYTTKQEREQYYDLCLQSIQNIRKLRHPRILKILEVNEKKPDIAFASEPVFSCINASEKMHSMDASYISLQIAEVLGFLNQDARLAHLGLSPTAVVLNFEMSVKLIHFQWSTPLTQEGLLSVPDKLYTSKVLTEYRYKPPEVLSKKEVNGSADVFIFGLFMYSLFTGESLFHSEAPNEILSEMPTRICNIYNVPAEFKGLLQQCVSLDPNSRPTFLEILQNKAFQSMQLKSLRYLDMILTKDPQDKFKFYKGLSMNIDDFSPSLSRIKILPILLKECSNDVRFAPVLLEPILKISSSFSKPDFMRVVWSSLSFLTNVTNPPEVSIALLKHLKQIMEKIDRSVHKDHVYPIVFSALQSGDARIHREVISQLRLVIDEMSEVGIRGQILPRVLDLAQGTPDAKIAADAIRVVKDCLSKIDNDAFATDGLPRLAQIWQKARNAAVGFAIVETVEVLKASNDVLMTKAIPIAAEILGTHAIEGDVKDRLCDWMIEAVRRFKTHGRGDGYSVTRATADVDNPFGQPSEDKKAPAKNQSQQNQTQTQAKKNTDNVKMFSAADIFGEPKKNSQTISQKPPQSAQSFAQSDTFGQGSRQTSFGFQQTAAKPANSVDIDLFGPPPKQVGSFASQPQQQQQTKPNIDVFRSDMGYSGQNMNQQFQSNTFGSSGGYTNSNTNWNNSGIQNLFGQPQQQNVFYGQQQQQGGFYGQQQQQYGNRQGQQQNNGNKNNNDLIDSLF